VSSHPKILAAGPGASAAAEAAYTSWGLGKCRPDHSGLGKGRSDHSDLGREAVHCLGVANLSRRTEPGAWDFVLD
jgi:hypothetical protein